MRVSTEFTVVPAQTFISYSNTDWDAAVELCERLRGAGITCPELRLPGRWMTGLQHVLAECNAFVVLMGRDGVQRFVGAECEVALNRHLAARGDAPRLPIHPLLLPCATPQDLPPFLALFQAESWAPGTALPEGLCAALREGVERLQQGVHFEGCPFRGLGAFRREHAALFFGRQAETLQALAGLGDQLHTTPDALAGLDNGRYHRWLQVEGNSGSGKSSLVQAGLLPLVESGGLWARTGLAHWRVLGPMVPGAKPLANLAEALRTGLHAGQHTSNQPPLLTLLQQLESDPRALAFAVREAKVPDTGFLLVVDQFEELYTLAEEAERKQFDALLAGALADAECPLFVVTTMRADFLDRIEQLPQLNALYNERCKRLFLSTITSAGLRDAIERPAALAGLDVSEVSTAMQEQARDEPGALPLVENALRQLWGLREGNKISGDEFRARGGLTGMLSSGADALLARIESALPKKGRAAALELLLRLTRVSPDGRHTRRRVSRAEAVQAAGNGDAALGERVLRMLSGERATDRPADFGANALRLVTAAIEPGEPESPYVELMHETLLRSRQVTGSAVPQAYWPALHDHIEANRENEVLRQQLSFDAQRWQRGSRLTRLRRLADGWQQHEYRHLRPAPDTVEALFLRRSRLLTRTRASIGYGLAATSAALLLWGFARNMPYVFVGPLWHLSWAVPADPEAVSLPPGRFDMGCKVGRDVDVGEACTTNDLPLREVALAQPCAMAQTTVTFWQYDYYVWASRGQGAVESQYPNDAFFGRLQRPVINVTWHEAQAYARWLSQRTGQPWRLPTSEEWEYAARGGKDARYAWGDDLPQGKANCKDCGDDYSNRETAPVRSYAANAYGLYDMTGNVWQWLEDKELGNDAARLLRGGSWFNVAGKLRSSDRGVVGTADLRGPDIGFRVCRVSAIEKPATGALTTEQPKR